jgi:hypothetical protein
VNAVPAARGGSMMRVQAPRMTSGTVVAVVMLTLLVVGIAYRYWPDDERAVRRHLIHLAEALSVPGKETEVEHLTRVAALREYFAPDVRVVADGREIVSRDELIGRLMSWTPPPGGFSVEVENQSVAMAEDRSTARIALTAKVVSKDLATGEAIVDARGVEMLMTRTESDWVITTAATREMAPRPSPQ